MRRRFCFGHWMLPLLLAVAPLGSLHAAVAQEVDAAPIVRSGAVKKSSQSDLVLERMLLLLKPGASQQQALDILLAAQQTPGNSKFHKWVSPTEFADRYSLSVADSAQVVSWLRSLGFSVAELPVSRGWVEFSGTASQVKSAFGTEVAAESGSSGTVYHVVGNVQIPAALADKVQGLVSLDGAFAVAATTAPAELETTPKALTAAASVNKVESEVATPSVASAWLHFGSDRTAGTGENIAIPARSNVRPEDFEVFRSSFGLPDETLQVVLAGADPGRTADEVAAIEAASWAGVVAPSAQIVLVPVASTNATDGIDLALAAAIDGSLAHTVSVGYTSCESGMSAAHLAFYAALYRQASAEGIADVAATGDSGAAACHTAGDVSAVGSGLAVNGLASTPWNTAVGSIGLSADAKSMAAWEPVTSTDAAYATGGGASSTYSLPLWQSASGMPNSDPASAGTAPRHRLIPDVSLPAAMTGGGGSGLAFCFSGEQAQSGCRLVTARGSNVAAAIFAGVAAQIAQKYGPQGNLAPNLYALNRTEQSSSASTTKSTAFIDVTAGAARLWCAIDSANCQPDSTGAGRIGFTTAEGYDLASGLGSVDVKTLVQTWATPDATGTALATVEMTTAGGVTYNPSANIVLSAKVISGSGGAVPTGTIQFYDQTTGGNTGTPVTLSSAGTASFTENGEFTNGGHNIAALYSGDSTYAAAQSQPVTINIQPSPTTLIVTPSTTTPVGGSSITVTGAVTSTNPGTAAPTGTLTVNLDGVPQGNALLTTTGTTTSAAVTVPVPTAGAHTVQGTYSGDSNYNNSTSQSVTIAVTKVTSVTGIAATPSTLTTGVPETFTATVAPASVATGAVYSLTGTVSFYDGGVTLLGTAVVSANTAILTNVVLSTTSAHTITAVYSGDTTYTASTSSPLLLQPILLPVTVTLTESNAVLAPDQPVTLTATVTPVSTPPLTGEQNPSGYVLFYAGSTLISGQVPVVQGLGNTGVASTVVPHLPAGQYVVTAHYLGDSTFGPAVSNSLNLQAEDFTISCSTTNIDMVQGTSQAVTCNVASLGGLAGQIQVACAEQNPPQVGPIACTFTPDIINGTGQTTLTVVTLGGAISANRYPQRPGSPPGMPLGAAGGGVLLAFAGLLLSPDWPTCALVEAGWRKTHRGLVSVGRHGECWTRMQ